VTPIGVQQDGGEKIAKDAIKVVHLDADSTTTDYVLKFLGSVFIGCVGAETDGRLSRSLGHSHTAHAAVERLSGHPVWNGDLRKNATGLLHPLLYINPAALSTLQSVSTQQTAPPDAPMRVECLRHRPKGPGEEGLLRRPPHTPRTRCLRSRCAGRHPPAHAIASHTSLSAPLVPDP
jgi:hypothetical protein